MAQADYHRTLERLLVAVKKELDADGICMDATIHRFELCFELAWKVLRDCLVYEGIETNSPRSCIREGWKQGMIADAEVWLDMQDKRKLSSYTNNESMALEVYKVIKNKYVALLLAWDEEDQRRLEPDMSI